MDIQNGVHSPSNAYLHLISLWNELVWYHGNRIVYNIFELLDKSAVKLETKNDRHDCCQEHNCISFVSFIVHDKPVYNNIADFGRQWSLFCKHDIRKEKIHKNGGHYALFTSYTCLDRGVVYISRLFLAEHVYMNVVYKVGLQSSV